MPDSTIVERIPQAEAPTAAIPIDLRRQYASGGSGVWYGTAARSLPWTIDDLTFSFGDSLYERMMEEPVIAAGVNIFKAGVLSDGVSLTSAVENKDDPDFDTASELVSWCEAILNDLDVNLDDVLFDMLNAIPYGNKAAELIYEPESTYTGREQVILRGMHVKPRHALAMVVDAYKTLLGFLCLVPGGNIWPMTGVQIPDLAKMENFVPVEKFAVYTFRPADNDPRGTSILRPAYDSWWRKQQTKVEHQKYMSRFASPSLAGFTPKGALPVQRVGADGSPVFDATGAPVYDSPAETMRDDLLAFQNGTVVVMPDGSAEGSKLQVVQVAGDGKAFLSAFEMHDREITKAILTATLAVGEGEHASRAQAGVHQDAQGTLTRMAKRGVCTMLRSVLARLITYNYGTQAKKLTPRVSLGEVEAEDISKVWTAVAALSTSGYLDDSQKPALDLEINLPERVVPDATLASVDAADPAADPGAADPAADPGAADPAADPGAAQPNQAPATQSQPATPLAQPAGERNTVQGAPVRRKRGPNARA